MYKALRPSNHKSAVALLITAGALAAFILFRMLAADPQTQDAAIAAPTATPYLERTLPINLTQTMGGFTVELADITDTADGMRLNWSYQTDISELDYLSIGFPEIRYTDGAAESAHGAPLPAPGEQVDISLGAFVVADAKLTGAVDIPLSALSDIGDLSPQPELLVGDKRYAVTRLSLETIPGFGGIRLIVNLKPLNRAAEYGMLGTIAASSVHATLADIGGRVYEVAFGNAGFNPFNQALTEQSPHPGSDGKLNRIQPGAHGAKPNIRERRAPPPVHIRHTDPEHPRRRQHHRPLHIRECADHPRNRRFRNPTGSGLPRRP